MKRKDERVEVRLKDGLPAQFIRTTAPAHRRRERTTCTIVDVLEEWHVSGRWWARETTRHYMLVRTDHGTFELCHEQIAGSGHRWILTGVSD